VAVERERAAYFVMSLTNVSETPTYKYMIYCIPVKFIEKHKTFLLFVRKFAIERLILLFRI
jgi:hypothetical protein